MTVLRCNHLFNRPIVCLSSFRRKDAHSGLPTYGAGSPELIRNIRRWRLPSVERLNVLCEVLELEFYIGPAREAGAIDERRLREAVASTERTLGARGVALAPEAKADAIAAISTICSPANAHRRPPRGCSCSSKPSGVAPRTSPLRSRRSEIPPAEGCFASRPLRPGRRRFAVSVVRSSVSAERHRLQARHRNADASHGLLRQARALGQNWRRSTLLDRVSPG